MAGGGIFYWLVTVPFRVVLGAILAVGTLAVIVVVAFVGFVCAANLNAWWRSPRMRRRRLGLLGGVTTLTRRLREPCALCRDTMEAGDEVRMLSCDHVFHRGGTDKCGFGIDGWLLAGDDMLWQSCPTCRRTPHTVLPWKRPPPSSYSGSEEEDSEEELLFPSHWFDDEALSE